MVDGRSIWAAFRFEWRRSLSGFRIASWCVLAFFTPVLIFLVQSRSRADVSQLVMGSVIFVLVVEVTCLLGLLLWGAPLIQSELESNSWIYLAVRPRGRIHLLLGKYVNAVTWVFLAALTAISITAPFVWMVRVGQFWTVIVTLAFLSSLSYGALYVLMAVIFPKRAMVFAVAYTLIFEGLVSLVPATVNRLTIQYRLRSLLFRWMDWYERIPEDARILLSKAPAWQNVGFLLGLTALLLGAAVVIIQYREYAVNSPD
ncbi:MAG TPA: hypothetical protein ENJ50_02580 [Planctomycetaceae bacterium]|nr:hypothetical protein [Planctomycetaceae bacterium]